MARGAGGLRRSGSVHHYLLSGIRRGQAAAGRSTVGARAAHTSILRTGLSTGYAVISASLASRIVTRLSACGPAQRAGAQRLRALANLFLHYAFDLWMQRKYPGVRFERYADELRVPEQDDFQQEMLRACPR